VAEESLEPEVKVEQWDLLEDLGQQG